jgi:hypothetical protein
VHPSPVLVVESASFASGETTHDFEVQLFRHGGRGRFIDGRDRADHDAADVDDDHDDADPAGDYGNAADHQSDDNDADPAHDHH